MKKLLLALLLLVPPVSAHDAVGVKCSFQPTISIKAAQESLWMEGVFTITNNSAVTLSNPYMEIATKKANGTVLGTDSWRPASLAPGQTRSKWQGRGLLQGGLIDRIVVTHCHREGS